MPEYHYNNDPKDTYRTLLSVGTKSDPGLDATTQRSVWTDLGNENKSDAPFQLAMDAMQMQGTRRLEFNDAGVYIHSAGDGTLDLVSDGTSDADAINIESTSGITLDAGDATYGITYEDDGTQMLRITNSSSDVIFKPLVSNADIIFQEDGATEIARFDSSAESLLMGSSKKLMLGAAEEYLYGDGTDIHIGVGSGGDINIPQDVGLTFGNDGEKIEGNGTKMTIGGGGVDITATAASTWHTSSGDLTIGGTAQAGAINIKSVEDTADSIVINATTGGIDITADGAAGKDLDLTCTNGSVNITAGESVTSSIVISSTNGGIDIAAAGASAGEDIDITATGSSVNITATEDATNAIYLHTNGGSSETIQIRNDQGTAENSIYVLSDVGGISIESGKTGAITNMASDSASSITNAVIRIGTDTANCDIAIGNGTSDVLIGDNLKVSGDLHVTGTQSYSALTVSHSSKSVITLTNTEESDADGGRDGWLVFTGETAAGSGHQIAYIKAIHDSTDSDKDGALEFYTNDGGDSDDALTKRLELDNAGNVRCQGAVGLPATSKLYLDGEDCSGNTYIHESGADQIQLVTGAGVRLEVDDNTKISLSNNDAGASNTIFGYSAGAAIASGGDNNSFFGKAAGNDVTTGDSNTAVGSVALSLLSSNSFCTAVGASALFSTTGTANTAVGASAGTYISSGAYNTYVGTSAGLGASGASLATGDNNTAIGYSAGVTLITSAHSNTFVGSLAGNTTTTGVANTIVGYNCEAQDATATKQIIIGVSLNGTADDAVFIGDDGDHIRCDWGTDATWDKVSDERKKNVSGDSPLGLEFINELRTVAFTYKAPCDYPKEWTSYNADKTEPRNKEEQHGMLAQDVKKALDNAGVDTFSGWSEDPDGCQRIGTSAFVYPLIKAIQELSAKVAALENK